MSVTETSKYDARHLTKLLHQVLTELHFLLEMSKKGIEGKKNLFAQEHAGSTWQ